MERRVPVLSIFAFLLSACFISEAFAEQVEIPSAFSPGVIKNYFDLQNHEPVNDFLDLFMPWSGKDKRRIHTSLPHLEEHQVDPHPKLYSADELLSLMAESDN